VPASASSSTPAQDVDRALQHYHTDIEHFRQMVLRALSSLRADLDKNDTPLDTTAAKSAVSKSGDKTATVPAAPDEVPSSRKSKTKKSEPNNTWPAPEDEEEVETINFAKKS